MNVLVLGSGGREHALCWRMAQDQSCKKIYAWSGNPGMEHAKLTCLDIPFSKQNLKEVIELYRIDLVVPGAEKFLYDGVADWCREWNVNCFGPTGRAAMLERSKLFSKKLMTEAGVPTARYADLTAFFNGDLAGAQKILKDFNLPVIKISGPSLGKGVFVCSSADEAMTVLEDIKRSSLAGLEEGIFVEEGISGKEVSLFYACAGEKFSYLGAAQDHKRLLDNDEGPNTGGMGAISPVPWVDREFETKIAHEFVAPTLKRMKEIGAPFKGVLFIGLMVNETGPYLLEYNVRFGDPETQVLLPLIEGDLTRFLYEMEGEIKIKDAVAIHVVKAAKGYPGTFGTPIEKGQKIINTITPDDNSLFFFAGVKKMEKDLVTNGGRVLGVTTWGRSKEEARRLAYSKLPEMSFSGEQYRQDIGSKT